MNVLPEAYFLIRMDGIMTSVPEFGSNGKAAKPQSSSDLPAASPSLSTNVISENWSISFEMFLRLGTCMRFATPMPARVMLGEDQ